MILNRISFILSVFGLMVAAYLWNTHSHPQDIPCGLTHGGCVDVANSPYSRFPIGSGPPVAAYGTFGYLLLIILSVLRTTPQTHASDRKLLGLSLGVALFGMAASVYLTLMEAFKIHAYCQWCLISQGIMAGVFILRLTEWFTWRGPLHKTENL
jgi:uncharacterized membrane protein